MNVANIGEVLHEALLVAIKLAAPTLLSCMLVGVVSAIFQAVTQIHEQSLAFILKLVVVFLYLLAGGSWMLSTLQDYFYYLFEIIAK